MVNAWKATQSDQEVLCESLIQCLHETPNEQGQGVPKPEFNELIACLEKFCTNQGDCAHFTFLFLLQLLVIHKHQKLSYLPIYNLFHSSCFEKTTRRCASKISSNYDRVS